MPSDGLLCDADKTCDNQGTCYPRPPDDVKYNICFRLLLSEQLLYGQACLDDQGRDAQLQSHHLRSSPLVGLGTIQSALQFYPTSPSRMGLLPFGRTISGPPGMIRFKLLMKMYPVGVAGTSMYLSSMSVIWWCSA